MGLPYMVLLPLKQRVLIPADMFEIVNEAILVHPLFERYVDFHSKLLKEAKRNFWFVVQQTHYIVCTVFLLSHNQSCY